MGTRKSDIRIGIVGFGGQGSLYVGFMKAGLIRKGKLAAVCDINEDKLNKQYDKFHLKCKKFTSYRDMIESGCVDAIIVTTPHYFHPVIVEEALKHNIHALSDKPAGVYTKQVKDLIKVSEEHPDIYCGLMLNQRTNNTYKKMKKLITKGTIGDIKRVNWIITDWYRPQSYYDSSTWRATWIGEGGGVLFNQSPHQLDLLQWITGMMPVKIRAFCHFGKWHNIETEDDVTAYFEYDNGATGTFITTTADYPGSNRLEITGTKGTIVCTDGKKLKLTLLDKDEREFNNNYQGGFGNPRKKSKHVITKKISGMHVEALNNFINSIYYGSELNIKYSEGLNGVEIADAMLLSQWLNKEVELPINDELYYSELQKRISNSKLRIADEQVLNTKGTF